MGLLACKISGNIASLHGFCTKALMHIFFLELGFNLIVWHAFLMFKIRTSYLGFTLSISLQRLLLGRGSKIVGGAGLHGCLGNQSFLNFLGTCWG